MKTSLDEIWNPVGKPGVAQGSTEVAECLARILKSAEVDFAATFGSGIHALAATTHKADELLRELGEVSTNTALARGQAIALTSPNDKFLAIQLEDFAGQIDSCRHRVQSALENSRQNVRALFSDAGAWAMHFSVVRMTLGTFFMTAAWGLVTLKWNEERLPLLGGLGCVALGGGLFVHIYVVSLQEVEGSKDRQGPPHERRFWRQVEGRECQNKAPAEGDQARSKAAKSQHSVPAKRKDFLVGIHSVQARPSGSGVPSLFGYC